MFLVGGVLQSLGQKNKARRRAQESLGSAQEAPEEDAGDLLAAIRKAMEAAAEDKRAAKERRPSLPQMRVAPPNRPPVPPPADDLFSEEAESLEVEPEIQSLENLARRRERVVVDHDDEISELVRVRTEWAERYAKPKTPAEHRDFDRKIREAKPAAPPTVDEKRLARLRQAVIWMEVLGKPVSLRDYPNVTVTQPTDPPPKPRQSPT